MDHRSLHLMEDDVLEGESTSGKSSSRKNDKDGSKQTKFGNNVNYNKLKVEMQNLQISSESEKELYSTLKHIHGPSFKLFDESEIENKNSNLGKQYWMERGNLVVKGIVDYSSKDSTPKSDAQITQQFATSKLESYSFHTSHCTEALLHTKGDMGKALEVLFCKYYGIEKNDTNSTIEDVDMKELLEKRCDEKEALESIYGDMFIEKIKNQIWVVQIKLDYLVNNGEVPEEKTPKKKQEKEVCRLYLYKKCRFGTKCRFLHQQPQVSTKREIPKYDPHFTLEIRFPEGCKYPHEPPYFYFYKNDGSFPRLNCLRIGRRLYEEALTLSMDGIPSIFSVISLLENEYDMKEYLERCKELFLDENDVLFPKSNELNEQANTSTHYELGSTNKNKRDNISWEEIVKEDDFIQKRFKEKQTEHQYLKMKKHRIRLPAWSMTNEILEIIQNNQVAIISGETGCGKSTQVPQFILDNWLNNRSSINKEHINVICTQPRRISAIGVAERVAAERSEYIGNTVGYQIRLENKLSKKTRLTFCTTGILLQRLSANPYLEGVTHVIVDEVHERSAEIDFLLMLLKQILSVRPDLKIILMSATIKADSFSSYFGNTPTLCIPGKTYPVEQLFLEDVFDTVDYIMEENSKYTRKIRGGWEQLMIDLETAEIEGLSANPPKPTVLDENLMLSQVVSRYKNCSVRTHKNLYVMDHERTNYEFVEKILEWIVSGYHDYPKTGSILVFLEGFSEILTLRDQLKTNKMFLPENKQFLILPLHSSLSSEEQQLVFKKTEEGVRKIILSTNIAETSITIDDCVFVIDTGKMKETRFNSNQNMESLETCWISQANALQRKGRAGRVMPGVCIHLYTSYRFKYRFCVQPIAEILRISLEPLLLRIKLINKTKKVDLHKSLERMLEPPTSENISNAIKRLQDVGALNSECDLTPLGHHLAALPVNVRIGKLILYGAIFCCLDSALTIAACLSHKNPFVTQFEKRYETNVKKDFLMANSDQLTTLRAYKKWLEACSRSDYAGQMFANQNSLSLRTLRTLADIKHQFLELLVSIGFVPVNLPRRKMGVDTVSEITGPEININNENYKLLQGLLCAALYPNVVKVFTPEKSFQLQSVGAIPVQPNAKELRFRTKQDEFVSIHPSSVNFNVGYFPSPYLVYQEKIKTSKVFIKEVSMVPTLPLVLFSSYEINVELHNGIFILSLEDGWILFSIQSYKIGQLLQGIRTELTRLLQQKMEDPLLNLLNHPNGKKIICTIVNIVTRE